MGECSKVVEAIMVEIVLCSSLCRTPKRQAVRYPSTHHYLAKPNLALAGLTKRASFFVTIIHLKGIS